MTLPVRGLCLALSLSLFGCDGDGDGDADTADPTGATTTGGNGGNGGNGSNGGNGGGAGHAAACAGDHVGSYQVDGVPLSGDVEAELVADGTLYVTFTSTSGDTNSDGFVAADGTMSGEDDGVTITGAYDFATCAGTGTWFDLSVGAGGTYELSRE